MARWTNNPYHTSWQAYLETERAQLAQRASGQMRRAIGRVLEGESEEDLKRIAREDERRARAGLVPLREDGKLYYKHIDHLSRKDVGARLEAERVTLMWLRGRIEGEKIAAQLHQNAPDHHDA
jgi:hypothetical protein